MRLLADDDFAAVRDHLAAAAGLFFDGSRRPGLSAVVNDRLMATGAPDVPAYLDMLAATDRPDGDGDPEWQRLLDAVTVQETQFFRNAPQMEALRRRVLPELLRRTAGRDRPLTIWSAGCSTGEEPYTLAMLLLELAPTLASRGRARVIGTDVSAEALRAAHRSTYTGRTLDAVPSMVRDRWLEPRAGGAVGVKEPVRALVDLRLHNLVNDPPPFTRGEVDLVVCRNVTIYFSRETTAALVGRFHNVLGEGGYLLLGHAETLWQVSSAFTLMPLGDAFVYRKSFDARQSAPSSRLARPMAAAAVAVARAATSGTTVRQPSRPRPTPPQPRPGAHVADLGAQALLDTARGHLRSGDYAGAAAVAETALRGDPLLAGAYVVLGRARCTLAEDTAALAPLRKAVFLEPTAGDAHFLLAGALSRLGRHAAAAASYRAAAATVGALDAARLRELLDGRDLVELVALCRTLADGADAHGAAVASDVAGVGS